MYTKFYGFSERPFDVAPDPRFLFLTGNHREALASMIYGLKERKGFVSVTGEIGTGKTVLIHTLLRNLDGKTRVIHLSHTNITFEQLLKTVFLELALPFSDPEKHVLLHDLHGHLLRKWRLGENVALIIDEAQNLSKEVMEEIRMLSNLETATAKLIQVLLVGQPELEAKLNCDDLRQLKQRIGIRRRIKPLDHDECCRYIEHRLELVGSRTQAVFAPGAISLIYTHTKGIPRSINILCDNAFLIGFSREQKRITTGVVEEVIADMDGEWAPPTEIPAADRKGYEEGDHVVREMA